MATSQKAFDQVKNILGRLDRNIDSLREQRTGSGAPSGVPGSMNGSGHSAPQSTNGVLNNATSRPAMGPIDPHRFSPDQLIGVPKNAAPAPGSHAPPLTPFSQQPNAAGRSPWGRAQPLRRDAGAA